MRPCFAILFILFYAQIILPQNDTAQFQRKDSSANKLGDYESNFFKQEVLNLKELGKYLHQNRIGLQVHIPQIVNQALFYYRPKDEDIYNSDKLKGFKESYSFLMKAEYKNLFKYDLGVVGKYLGISQNILAIILAIISVTKY